MKIKQTISTLLFAALSLAAFNSCSDVPEPYPIPGGDQGQMDEVYGTGEKETPYTIDGAKLNQEAQYAFVKAFIVGYIPTGQDISTKLSDAVFSADGAGASNIVIAASADETNPNNCMAVQLPVGDARTALNLQNNPGNLGKEVTLYGTMEKYFGAAGVKNVQAWIMDGTEGGDMPSEGGETGTALFSEAFATSLGGFTINNVIPAEGLGQEVWTYDGSYKCAKGTSYTGGQGGTNVPTESWLVSPAISLKEVQNATLTFDHAANYFDDVKKDVTVWITDAANENWTQLNIPTYPTSFTFVNSGDVDLNAYKGKDVKIGFKYVCTTKAGTYELKNFKVEDRAAEAQPETPVGDSSKENPYAVAKAIEKYDANAPQANTWVKGYIVGYVTGMSINAESAIFGTDGEVANTNILLADKADEKDYTKCLIIQLPAGNIRTALNLADHPENLGKETILMGSLEKYFGTYGLKSVSEYVLNGGGTEPGEPEEPEIPVQGDAQVTVAGAVITITSSATASNTVTSSDLNTFGWINQGAPEGASDSEGTAFVFAQEGGNNAPLFYDGTKGVRMYALNSLTLQANKPIAKVVLQCDSYNGTDYVGNTQLYAKIEGNNWKIVNDHTANSGGVQLRIKNIEITYAN